MLALVVIALALLPRCSAQALDQFTPLLSTESDHLFTSMRLSSSEGVAYMAGYVTEPTNAGALWSTSVIGAAAGMITRVATISGDGRGVYVSGLALSANDSVAYVSGELDTGVAMLWSVSLAAATLGTVSVVSAGDNWMAYLSIALSVDGSVVYAVAQGGTTATDITLTAISLTGAAYGSVSTVASLPMENVAFGLALSSDGAVAYVCGAGQARYAVMLAVALTGSAAGTVTPVSTLYDAGTFPSFLDVALSPCDGVAYIAGYVEPHAAPQLGVLLSVPLSGASAGAVATVASLNLTSLWSVQLAANGAVAYVLGDDYYDPTVGQLYQLDLQPSTCLPSASSSRHRGRHDSSHAPAI